MSESFPLIELNRENLDSYSKSLLGNNFSEEIKQKLLQFFDNNERKLTYWNLSLKSATDLLFDLDRILKNCGIEYLFDQNNPIFEDTNIIYSNSGDTYSTTIIYYNGAFYIGDWGSLFEWMERNYEE